MGGRVRVEGGVAIPFHVSRDEFVTTVDQAVVRSQPSLIELQRAEGYWHAPLEANAQMNAEFIIFSHFVDSVEPMLEAKLAKFLLDTQQPDGSWNLYRGGEGYLSYSIEAYFALKLAGSKASDDPMVAARSWILSRGGIEAAGTLARFYLASLGQVPWDATAALPVELALLPVWFPVNVYELASWARGTLFSLMALQSSRPVIEIEPDRSAFELYCRPLASTKFRQPRARKLFSLRNCLNVADRVLRIYDHHHFSGLRARALQCAETWLIRHQDANGSFGGIEPCYLLTPMALRALGYRNDHPVMRKAIEATRELVWDFGDTALCMPCVSPNWNTALAVKALLDSDLDAGHPALQQAGKWLINHQIFKRGDWAIKRPYLEPGGWAFEFYNDWYPDVDDSAVIVMTLARTQVDNSDAKERAVLTGANWVIGMQSRDGGFAAFDADNDSEWLNHLPLADVEAVTDPSCADLTGRVLEMMGTVGYRADHPIACRAVAWLKRHQTPEGAWWGRWGVAYIYGTFSALAGLRAVGVDLNAA